MQGSYRNIPRLTADRDSNRKRSQNALKQYPSCGNHSKLALGKTMTGKIASGIRTVLGGGGGGWAVV